MAGQEHSRRELYERARDLDVPGRSKMDKEELAVSVQEAQAKRRR